MSPDRSGGGIKVTWYGPPIETLIGAASGAAAGVSKAANQTPIIGEIPVTKRLVLKMGDTVEKIFWSVTESPGAFTANNQTVTSADLTASGYRRAIFPTGTEIIYQRVPVRVIVTVNGKQTYDKLDKAYLYAGQTFTIEPRIVNSSMAPYTKTRFFDKYRQDPIGNRLVPLRDLTNPVEDSGAKCSVIWDNTDKVATVEIIENSKISASDTLVTESQLQQMGWNNVNDALIEDLNSTLRNNDITTVERIRHFISQCAHESGLGFYSREIADGTAYEGRSDLGNIYPGDGPKFKGAGYIQLTGRYNYQQFANHMNDQRIMEGVDYVAANYPWSSAGFWWNANNMNALVDDGATVRQVTLRVNGGLRGLSDREEQYQKAVTIFK